MKEEQLKKSAYLIPTLVGTVVMVVPSLISFNLKAFGSWLTLPLFFVLGGLAASYWIIRESPFLSLTQGSLAGSLAGLFGSLFLIAGFWASLTPGKYLDAIREYRSQLERQRQLALKNLDAMGARNMEKILEILEKREKSPEQSFQAFRLYFSILNFFFTTALGFLGGILGTVIFRKKPPLHRHAAGAGRTHPPEAV